MTKNHPFKQLIHNSDFVKLWMSQILSQVTINLMTFIVLTRIFEVTRSNVAVSMLWIASSLPALFFGPFSGAIVDNFSRRKMLIVTNLLQAVSVASFLLIRQRVFSLYAVVFLYWLIDQLYLPSQQATLPSLVGGKLLSTANGLFLMTQQMSFLVGFGMGGLFLTVLGRSNTVIFASILLFGAAIAVYLLPQDLSPTTLGFKNLGRFWTKFYEGYKFIQSHTTILLPLLVLIFSQIFVAIISSVLPAYTRTELGLDLKHVSLVMVMPAALGAIVLTTNITNLLKKYRKKDLIEWGLLGASVSLFLLAILPSITSFRVILGTITAGLLGVSFAAVSVPAQTALQQSTPAWFRGRVYGSLSFLLIIATSAPLLLATFIADNLGLPIMFALLSGLLLMGFIYARRKGDYVLANGFGI